MVSETVSTPTTEKPLPAAKPTDPRDLKADSPKRLLIESDLIVSKQNYSVGKL